MKKTLLTGALVLALGSYVFGYEPKPEAKKLLNEAKMKWDAQITHSREHILSLAKKSVEIDSCYADAYVFLGNRTIEDTVAINYYKKAISVDSSCIDAYIQLAGLYGRKKNFSESLVLLEKAAKINPMHKGLNYHFAGYFYRIKQYNNAKEYALKSLNVDSNFVPAKNMLKRINKKLKR